MILSSHFDAKRPTLNLNIRLPVRTLQAQATYYSSQSNNHSRDTFFFSGKSESKSFLPPMTEQERRERDRHRLTEQQFRTRRKDDIKQMEAACKAAGIDIRTLYPPKIDLPPKTETENMTEEAKKDRRTLSAANSKARKKEYISNLRNAVANIAAADKTNREVPPSIPESLHNYLLAYPPSSQHWYPKDEDWVKETGGWREQVDGDVWDLDPSAAMPEDQ